MRSSCPKACLEVCTASHTAVSSNARVWAGAVTRPRHGHHDHAMLMAAHPRRVRLHKRAHGAKVQRPPAPATLAAVKAWAAPRADPTASLEVLAGPSRHDDYASLLVVQDPPDDRALDTNQPGP